MPSKCTFCEATVLEKARNLFWERGYAATSIQDLEKALDIRRSSIYNTFGGKRELYNRTLEVYQQENQGMLRQLLTGVPSLRDALMAMFIGALELNDDKSKGCYLINATTELAAVDPELLAFVAKNREVFTAILAEALETAQQKGELKSGSNPSNQADYLFMCYSGLQVVNQTGVEPATLRKAISRSIAALDWED